MKSYIQFLLISSILFVSCSTSRSYLSSNSDDVYVVANPHLKKKKKTEERYTSTYNNYNEENNTQETKVIYQTYYVKSPCCCELDYHPRSIFSNSYSFGTPIYTNPTYNYYYYNRYSSINYHKNEPKKRDSVINTSADVSKQKTGSTTPIMNRNYTKSGKVTEYSSGTPKNDTAKTNESEVKPGKYYVKLNSPTVPNSNVSASENKGNTSTGSGTQNNYTQPPAYDPPTRTPPANAPKNSEKNNSYTEKKKKMSRYEDNTPQAEPSTPVIYERKESPAPAHKAETPKAPANPAPSNPAPSNPAPAPAPKAPETKPIMGRNR